MEIDFDNFELVNFNDDSYTKISKTIEFLKNTDSKELFKNYNLTFKAVYCIRNCMNELENYQVFDNFDKISLKILDFFIEFRYDLINIKNKEINIPYFKTEDEIFVSIFFNKMSILNDILNYNVKILNKNFIQRCLNGFYKLLQQKNFIKNVLEITIIIRRTFSSNFLEFIFSIFFKISFLREEFFSRWINLEVVNNFLGLVEKYPNKTVLIINIVYIVLVAVNEHQIENVLKKTNILKFIFSALKNIAKKFEKKNFERIKRQIIDDEKIIDVEIHIEYYEKCSSTVLFYTSFLYRLFISDYHREKYFDNDLNDYLKSILFYGNEIEKKNTLKLFALLSFNLKISQKLNKDLKLKDFLKGLHFSSNKSLSKICQIILFNIEQNKLNSKPSEHVMISFDSTFQIEALQIKAKLQNSAYNVWIQNALDSNFDSVKEAIEKSSCIILCFTPNYRLSINCQAEAIYSKQLNKPIIFLKERNSSCSVELSFLINIKPSCIINIDEINFEKILIDQIEKLTVKKINKEKEGIENSIPEIKCRICNKANTKIFQIDCGHIVCNKCLEKLPNKICPYCTNFENDLSRKKQLIILPCCGFSKFYDDSVIGKKDNFKCDICREDINIEKIQDFKVNEYEILMRKAEFTMKDLEREKDFSKMKMDLINEIKMKIPKIEIKNCFQYEKSLKDLRTIVVRAEKIKNYLEENKKPKILEKNKNIGLMLENIFKCTKTLNGHSKEVNFLLVLSNGNLASSSLDKTIRIWDKESFQCIQTLNGHQGKINFLSIFSNGNLVSGSDDKTIKVWDKDTFKCIKTLNGHKRGVNCLVVLSNGNLASSSLDYTIKIWDKKSFECIETLNDHIDAVMSLVELSNGDLASCSFDSTIKIWNMKNFQCIKTLNKHKKGITCLLVLPSGNLASGSLDYTIRIWDKDSFECIKTLNDHKYTVFCLAVLPSGNIVSGSDDSSIKIWDKDSFILINTLNEHQGWIYSLAVLPNGNLVSASSDNTIKIWDKESCTKILNENKNEIWRLGVLSSRNYK